MKTMLETKSGICFDLDEIAAVGIVERTVCVWLKGTSTPLYAGKFDDEKSAQIYRDLLIKEWCGDEDA